MLRERKLKEGENRKLLLKQLTYSSLYGWINRQLLLSMVMKVPDAHLGEYKSELEQRCGASISLGSLSNILKSNSISRKKVLRPPEEPILACKRSCTA